MGQPAGEEIDVSRLRRERLLETPAAGSPGQVETLPALPRGRLPVPLGDCVHAAGREAPAQRGRGADGQAPVRSAGGIGRFEAAVYEQTALVRDDGHPVQDGAAVGPEGR